MSLLVVLILFLAYIKFEPELDKLPGGEWIVWYNSGGNYHKQRKSFIIKK